MTLKQKVEDNLTYFVFGFLATGFVAGIAAYKIELEIAGRNHEPSPTEWQANAREANWLPRSDCPALPVSLALTNPGSGSILAVDGHFLQSDAVMQASRPLPGSNAVGLIVNLEGDSNYYVIDPPLRGDEGRRIFETRTYISLPFEPHGDGKLNVWGFTIDDMNRLGRVYGSLSQIQDVSPDVIVSAKVVVATKAK